MTAKERRSAMRRGAAMGLILGSYFAIIGFLSMPIGKWLFDSALIGMIIFQPLALVSVGVVFWKFKPLIDKYHKEFLASTTWAKECDLTPDKITLRQF